MARSGFKMKYSPAKGKLGDFFSSLGKQLRSNKKDIGGDLKKKYSSKAQRDNEVPRSGESEYQFKVRTRKARSKKAGQQAEIDPKSEVKIDPKVGRTRKARPKKADKPVTKTPEQKAKINPKSEVKIDPRVGMDRYTYTDVGDSKSKSNKPDWSKAPKVGTQARTDWYKKYNLALDPTTPGYKAPEDPLGDSITIFGPQGQGRQYAVDMKGNPINKKSPSKKRGYKMKRNK